MRLTSTVIESTSERNREANWRVLRIRDRTHSVAVLVMCLPDGPDVDEVEAKIASLN